jgi:hypothetical protein
MKRFVPIVFVSFLALMLASCGAFSPQVGGDKRVDDLILSLAKLHPALCVDADGKLDLDPKSTSQLNDAETQITAAAIDFAAELRDGRLDYDPFESDENSDLAAAEDPAVKAGSRVAKVYTSKTGPGESTLDVWIKFDGVDWWAVRANAVSTLPNFYIDKVIGELKKVKSKPETYFATKPGWATSGIPFRVRIDLETRAHIADRDDEMHFSEWWFAKNLWD